LDSSTDEGVLMDTIDSESIPSRFDPITKLYRRDGNLTRASLIDALNQGPNLVAHGGHGGWDAFESGDEYMSYTDAYGLTNAPRITGMLTTIACYVGEYDNPGYDCLAENFSFAPNGGGNFLGNSRFGWYYPGSPAANGISAAQLREEFKAIFQRGKTHLGQVIADMQTQRIPSAKGDGGERYCLYEHTLFGDPETPLWLNTPFKLFVTHQSSVMVGTSSVTVMVGHGATPLSGAKVCLWKNTEVYVTGTTGASGRVTLSISPATIGPLTVTVTSADALPYRGMITVTTPGQQLVYPSSLSLVTGTYLSGMIADLASSNDVWQSFRTATSGRIQVADIRYTGTTSVRNPALIQMTYEGHLTSPASLLIYLYNRTTANWEQVTTAALGTTDQMYMWATATNPGRFVDPATGLIQCRLYLTSYTSQDLASDLIQWSLR